MEKLTNLINQNPKFKSSKTDYLKLAVKEGNVVRGTGPHHVTLIGCENAVNKDYTTQKQIKGVNLLFEEGGETKKYFVPILGDDGKFHYLIVRFADIKEGTDLILEYRRKEGSVRGFIDVQVADDKISGEESGEADLKADIPIIEDAEYETSSEDFGPEQEI